MRSDRCRVLGGVVWVALGLGRDVWHSCGRIEQGEAQVCSEGMQEAGEAEGN